MLNLVQQLCPAAHGLACCVIYDPPLPLFVHKCRIVAATIAAPIKADHDGQQIVPPACLHAQEELPQVNALRN